MITPQATAYVIDDDDAVRDSIRMLLETSGYAVRSFDSATALLDEERPVKDSCLVIDVDMPGMGGLELLDRLRREGVTTPAIVTTGGLSTRGRAAVDQANAMLLEKPFAVGELVSCIKRSLGRYPS
jgi:FixJ family two-component response regulator